MDPVKMVEMRQAVLKTFSNKIDKYKDVMHFLRWSWCHVPVLYNTMYHTKRVHKYIYIYVYIISGFVRFFSNGFT